MSGCLKLIFFSSFYAPIQPIMKKTAFKFIVLSSMLLGLPMVGVWAAGYPIARYLEFPPKSMYVRHAPFSWFAFSCYAALILSVTLPMAIRSIRAVASLQPVKSRLEPFPWWGALGILAAAVSWILAWTRFDWFTPFQRHTFTPLWLSYILVVNALTYKKTGRCMMIDRPKFLLLLFPVSAVFWWFFEYLNRFVQNWQYTGVAYPSWEYFCSATLPFSTVLPAVLSTRKYLAGHRWINAAFGRFLPFSPGRPKLLGWGILCISAAGLVGIGVWSDYLFPLLWLSPLLIIVSLQVLMQEKHVFSEIRHGDWRFVVSAALAALCCGFFWEMWNTYSLAKWQYHIPFVDRYKIFEMPVLGYAGYFPFGLECALIGNLLAKSVREEPEQEAI